MTQKHPVAATDNIYRDPGTFLVLQKKSTLLDRTREIWLKYCESCIFGRPPSYPDYPVLSLNSQRLCAWEVEWMCLICSPQVVTGSPLFWCSINIYCHPKNKRNNELKKKILALLGWLVQCQSTTTEAELLTYTIKDSYNFLITRLWIR